MLRPHAETASASPSALAGTKSHRPVPSWAPQAARRTVAQARREVPPSSGCFRPGEKAAAARGDSFARRQRVIVVDHGERLQHVAALLGKTIRHLDELPPAVRQTVGHDRRQFSRQIPREGVTHLNRRGQLRRAPTSTSLRFSPACWRPLRNNAILCPSRVEMMPVVNMPVRSASRLLRQIFR